MSDSMEAKISDFGTVVFQGPHNAGKAVTNPRWLAPEVLGNEEYSSPSDVYSFGIMMWELAVRKVPFR
jgi:serine/threonine protein kinase